MNLLILNHGDALGHGTFQHIKEPLTLTTDIDFFADASAKTKIAVIEIPYYKSLIPVRNLIDRIKDSCNSIILRSVEGYGTAIKLMQDYDLPNISYKVGFIPNFELKNAKCDFDSYWFKDTAKVYSEGNSFISDSRLSNTPDKEYMFNVLYGQPKAHRTFIREYLGEDPRFLQSPFLGDSSIHHSSIGDTSSLFWEDDITPANGGMSFFMGKCTRLSQTMPFKVYNNSYYSLVCETWTDNEYSFFTEKTAKEIIAGRLFIPVSGQHFLRNFKKLGFRTFDNIIDESFDNIADHKTRWTATAEEAKKLCDKDPKEVLAAAQPIIEHNRARIMEMLHEPFSVEEEILLVHLADKCN